MSDYAPVLMAVDDGPAVASATVGVPSRGEGWHIARKGFLEPLQEFNCAKADV